MLTNPASSPRVRLDGSTNPQGLPALAPSMAFVACPDSHALASTLALRRSTMNASPLTAYAAFVGIDWADRTHDVCLQPTGCDQREFSVLPYRPECMAQWAQALRQRFEGCPMAVCLELRQGPLVDARQPYDCRVRFPVHPTMLAKSRDAFCLRHAKDDPTDAARALSAHPRGAPTGHPAGHTTDL
jgi:hypothetical protein